MSGGMRCSFMYCVCLEHQPSFSAQVPVQSLFTANLQSTLRHVFYVPSIWKTFAHMSWMEFEPTTFTAPCKVESTYLQAMESFSILKPFEDHFQLSTFPNPTFQYSWLAMQKVSNCCAERAWRNHEVIFLLTASDDRLDSLIIIALHKYILKNIHSLYWENDRQIILWIV